MFSIKLNQIENKHKHNYLILYSKYYLLTRYAQRFGSAGDARLQLQNVE